MDVKEAKEVLKEKEDAKLAEIEAKQTLEEAERQSILDKQKAEQDALERDKFLKERRVKNEKIVIKIKKQFIDDLEKVHYIEEQAQEAGVCELCGNEFKLKGNETEVSVWVGQDLMMTSGHVYQCSLCKHTETFVNGLRVRSRENKGVFGIFQ